MASRGEENSTGLPLTLMMPASCLYRPASTFINVLLPAPFSPSKAWISPARNSKSTWSLASTPGKRLTIPLISTTKLEGVGSVTVYLLLQGAEPITGPAPFTNKLLTEFRQFGGNAVSPPVHAVLACQPRGSRRELIEIS